MNARNPFNSLTNRLRLQSEVLEKFSELYSCDPEAAIELLGTMAREAGISEPAPSDGGRVTLYDRLRKYFEGIGNEWRSFEQIVNDLDASKNSIRQVFYKQQPNEFEKRPSPEGGRKVEWRLKDDGSGGFSSAEATERY
jgi:hypothetical protein